MDSFSNQFDPAGDSEVFVDRATRDSLDKTAYVETPGSGAVAATPNFCHRCGAKWDPAWTVCPNCRPAPAINTQNTAELISDKALGGSILNALALYFTSLLLLVALLYAVIRNPDDVTNSTIIFDVVFAIIITVWAAFNYRHVWPGLRNTGRLQWYPIAAALGCCTFAVSWLLVEGIINLLDIEDLRYGDMYLDAGYGWWAVIIFVCIQPAIFEELAFRGIILGPLVKTLGVRDAIIVSAFLFMLLHLAPLSFPSLFLMGLVVGYLRIKSGSLYPCMIMHFTHNFLVIMAEMAGY